MKELIRKILREEIITEARVKKSDRIDIYRDKNVIVVAPLTHEALNKYASECAWCINSDKYEWTHYHQGKIVVIIQKKPKNNKIGKTEQETPEEIYDFTHNGTRNEGEDDYFDELISSVSNFDTNIVYYNPEDEIIYDKGDNCMNDFGYSIYDIPHITEDIIKKIKSALMNDYLSTHQLSEQKLLKEEIEHGGGIFYHNSDYDIKSFIPQVKKTKKTNYLFFSNEPNIFIDRNFTYKVKLEFNPNKIFNTFRHITKYGIKYTLDEYKGEVLRLFENNTEYFIKEWENTGVDSVGEVMEYYLDEGGNEDDMVGLLYYFITKWNDSWAIIETDLFLNFIESKGYTGFVTQEEGLINIACKDFLSIDIINKQNMWDMN